jgi:hypothetical protein
MQDAEKSISQRETGALSSPPCAGVPFFTLRYPLLGTTKVVSLLSMTHQSANLWWIASGIVLLAATAGFMFWYFFRKRPTPEELERARRDFLVHSGRIVDGMLLEVCEVEAKDGRILTMIMFNYSIGGVHYECSQDITDMRAIVDATQVNVGFPCSVRYQRGHPQNSIVVAEHWTGIRATLPQFPAFEDPEPLDFDHLRPGRG